MKWESVGGILSCQTNQRDCVGLRVVHVIESKQYMDLPFISVILSSITDIQIDSLGYTLRVVWKWRGK